MSTFLAFNKRDLKQVIVIAIGVYAGMSAWSLSFRPVQRIVNEIPYIQDQCGRLSNPCVVEIAPR